MSDAIFPSIYPPSNPDNLQLYSIATPNGKKAGIMLEELGVVYDAHRVNIMEGDQFHPDFVALNPNSKIPALLDPNGPDGAPLRIMESGAILLYLADKFGKFIPTDAAGRSEVIQWLFFQMASVGPMFGQFGHFYKAAKGKTDTYGEARYSKEVNRLLAVLDKRLEGREYLVGEFSIADIATVPWVDALDFYDGKDAVGYDQFKNVHAWVERFNARPGVQRGVQVTAF